jgi:ribose 5-phosphate isomerase
MRVGLGTGSTVAPLLPALALAGAGGGQNLVPIKDLLGLG